MKYNKRWYDKCKFEAQVEQACIINYTEWLKKARCAADADVLCLDIIRSVLALKDIRKHMLRFDGTEADFRERDGDL